MEIIDLFLFISKNLNPTLNEKQIILSSEKDTNIPLNCFENIKNNINNLDIDIYICKKNFITHNTKRIYKSNLIDKEYLNMLENEVFTVNLWKEFMNYVKIHRSSCYTCDIIGVFENFKYPFLLQKFPENIEKTINAILPNYRLNDDWYKITPHLNIQLQDFMYENLYKKQKSKTTKYYYMSDEFKEKKLWNDSKFVLYKDPITKGQVNLTDYKLTSPTIIKFIEKCSGKKYIKKYNDHFFFFNGIKINKTYVKVYKT